MTRSDRQSEYGRQSIVIEEAININTNTMPFHAAMQQARKRAKPLRTPLGNVGSLHPPPNPSSIPYSSV
jgi:hypothetical protein